MNIRIGILTISDRSARGERPDLSGPALVDVIKNLGWTVSRQDVIPDDLLPIRDTLIEWTDRGGLDVILTTGGTGFSPRDVTPEATLSAVERPVPGLTEAMRTASLQITPHAMLSRAAAGIRKQTIIVNLPGSPRAATENLAIITPVLPHAVALLRDDPLAEKGHTQQTD